MLLNVIVRLVVGFYPEDRININYGTNNYNDAFKEIVSFNKDYNGLPHNKKPYINHRTFKSSYRIYVFDTRYQSDLFGFVNDLEKLIYGLGFKLKLKRNNNDRALYRVNANPGAVANDGNIEIRDISWCVQQQPIQLNFKFSAAVADVICHALVLTRKVISVNSDGIKMVDIIS